MLFKVVSFTVRPFCEIEKRRWNLDVEAEQIGRGGGDAQPALQNHHWTGSNDSWASALSRNQFFFHFHSNQIQGLLWQRGILLSRAHHPRQNLWVHRKCVIGTAGSWGGAHPGGQEARLCLSVVTDQLGDSRRWALHDYRNS